MWVNNYKPQKVWIWLLVHAPIFADLPNLHGQTGVKPWWRHQMETFSALLVICAGNSPVPGEFPTQRPVTRSFDVFFDLHRNKRLGKQSWGWWFETLTRPLWRHGNAVRQCLSIRLVRLGKNVSWCRNSYKGSRDNYLLYNPLRYSHNYWVSFNKSANISWLQ